MKRLKQLLLAAVVAFSFVLVPVSAVSAVDVDPLGNACANGQNPDSAICQNRDDSINDVITTVVNILLFIIGAIAVIMIIVGGIQYATSAGNAAQITTAKNTILYAVIGLVLAFVAYAIVNFVVAQFA
jgi:hypothetical protein